MHLAGTSSYLSTYQISITPYLVDATRVRRREIRRKRDNRWKGRCMDAYTSGYLEEDG